MSRLYHILCAAAGFVAAATLATPAGAGTTAYWGPHGGVAAVHTPGPYARPFGGPCCYGAWRGAGVGAVAAGVATGAAIGAASRPYAVPYPYPYGYPYPVYVAPRPIVYPPTVVVAPGPAYIYPARPVP